MRSKRRPRIVAALLFGILVLPSLGAQEEPPWLRVERADRLASEGEYGLAIQLYREALTLSPGAPEPLYGLGRAFVAINDYDIAEQYLLDARASSADLRVPEVAYEINYALASLYEVQRKYAEYEAVLMDNLTRAEAEPRDSAIVELRPDALTRVMREAGLDRVLVLYRSDEDGATQARGDLCELLVGLGRYETAIDFGIMAVAQRLTTVIEAVIERDPLYEYSTVRSVMVAGRTYAEVRNYLQTSLLYRDLYFLASAFFAHEDVAPARALWTLLSAMTDAGPYATRADIQLADPQIEPLLVPLD